MLNKTKPFTKQEKYVIVLGYVIADSVCGQKSGIALKFPLALPKEVPAIIFITFFSKLVISSKFAALTIGIALMVM